MPDQSEINSGHGAGGSAALAGAHSSTQARSNAKEWAQGDHLAAYAHRNLTPAEVRIFVEYREALSGRVLDLGCGGGRLLAYLLMFGGDVHGVDLSPKMVEHCRRAYPGADVRYGDVTSIGEHVEGTFDAVLAADNLIDVFDDAERRRVLAELRQIISHDGLLIFSTHDLAYLDGEAETPRTSVARLLLDTSPADLYRLARNRRYTARNRRRLAPLEQRHADHAIVNDHPNYYGFVHYYIRRDDQERQLAELGFELLECVASDGSLVAPGGTGPTDSLYYVARPR